MARGLIWWGLVALFAATSGYARYEARSDHAAAKSVDTLMPGLWRALSAQGFDIEEEIRDPDVNNQLIGYTFRGPLCDGAMKAIEFSVGWVSEAFATDHHGDGESHSFQFHGFSYETAARPRLTYLRIKHWLLPLLGIRDEISTSFQLVRIWPSHCDEPVADWAAIWRTEPSDSAADAT
ncbi:hypothetical protein [Pseudooceanicola sp.]|uniref:hypothetical protein n=1 Tax=Pseudooceanicola sp. TaxID=1914328 RepID=UPI002618259D|nr:hypothetical protein [Pseudooceanicola sp.]MDF1855063.1 hypothetical protein [Pseudooceanicola sp.]